MGKRAVFVVRGGIVGGETAANLDGSGLGGREEQGLPRARQALHDRVDRLLEAHVQDAVGFVQHCTRCHARTHAHTRREEEEKCHHHHVLHNEHAW
jgi:hypothetical protein